MTEREHAAVPIATVEEIQQGWRDLNLRVGQLEAEKSALEQENKTLRFLLERVIEHRQKSHSELVLLLTALVSKLPLNDVGTIVAKLVEHNSHVSEICAALVKGKADAPLPQPNVLKALEQTKQDLTSALKPLVEELVKSDTPLEADLLRSLVQKPELFFSQRFVRANRCFVKGQVPRERVVREFGDEALVFFQDMTTDPKLNPRPKPDEVALGFRSDFEEVFQKHTGYIPEKRQELMALYQRVQRSKAPTEQARQQRGAFQKLSFCLELLHYYEHQNTEAPDVIFAQRLPALVEQLVIAGPQDSLDEKLIAEAEELLAFIINPDHRHMVVNNVGKAGGVAKTLNYVLRLRPEKIPDSLQIIPEFIRHLIPPPPHKAPSARALAPVFRLVKPDLQRLVVRAIMDCDRLRREEAESLGLAVGKEMGLTGLETLIIKAPENIPAELERQMAWEKIKDLIVRRNDPTAIAAAIRDRLHTKYDADEIRQSWITLIEAEAIALIRVFCQIPYRSDGRTDSIARPVMETYVSRLTHEKYAATYTKVVTSLKNMFKANPDSPTLMNFMALVRWVDAEAANKISRDIGMPVAAA